MIESIGDKFAAAVLRQKKEINAQYFVAPEPLYNAYREQYTRSREMLVAMRAVLDDYEHQEIMEEGRMRFYNLPDEKAFARELAEYQSFISGFDPDNVVRQSDGRVRIPMQTALALHYMGEYNRQLSNYVLEAVLKTEYLRRFTERKRRGQPYFGPAAL